MRLIVFIFIFMCANINAQDDIFAKDYFENGEYEKALIEYKKLYEKSPNNINYINKVVESYQQLEQYSETEQFLLNLLERIKFPAFYIELGYNYQLQNDLVTANDYFSKALASIDINPNNVFSVARGFQKHTLLNEALLAYEKAMLLKPDLNFKLQMAQIYGEQGDVEKMLISYIDFAEAN